MIWFSGRQSIPFHDVGGRVLLIYAKDCLSLGDVISLPRDDP